jgi:hypothetical protein
LELVTSFSVENVDFNGIGAGTLVVFQGFFDADSSFGVTNGFTLFGRKKTDFKIHKIVDLHWLWCDRF